MKNEPLEAQHINKILDNLTQELQIEDVIVYLLSPHKGHEYIYLPEINCLVSLFPKNIKLFLCFLLPSCVFVSLLPSKVLFMQQTTNFVTSFQAFEKK